MTTQVFMACGHAANAVDGHGNPSCAICAGTPAARTEALTPDLTGRTARCGCGKEMPSSSPGLAFFEFRGPGSPQAIHSCKHCGYHDVAHEAAHMETLVHGRDGKRRPTVVEDGRCPGFEARGDWGTDSFYCGCRGWD